MESPEITRVDNVSRPLSTKMYIELTDFAIVCPKKCHLDEYHRGTDQEEKISEPRQAFPCGARSWLDSYMNRIDTGSSQRRMMNTPPCEPLSVSRTIS